MQFFLRNLITTLTILSVLIKHVQSGDSDSDTDAADAPPPTSCTTIKLTYWATKGRAEPIRLALAIGDIDFEDERITSTEFQKRKAEGKLPFGSLPMMTIDGNMEFAQSDAMLRYAGTLSNLYPTHDALKALKVDMVLGAIEDALLALFKNHADEEHRKTFASEGISRYFGPIERFYSENTAGPCLLGDELSIADLKLYVFHDTMKRHIDPIMKNVLDQFENIIKCSKTVDEHEMVMTWNAKHKMKL